MSVSSSRVEGSSDVPGTDGVMAGHSPTLVGNAHLLIRGAFGSSSALANEVTPVRAVSFQDEWSCILPAKVPDEKKKTAEFKDKKMRGVKKVLGDL
jgi:hypothetical protein